MGEQGNNVVKATASKKPAGHGRGLWRLLLSAVLLLLAVGTAYATADENATPETSGLPTAADVTRAIEGESSAEIGEEETDPEAAEELPHRDLGREEAAELLSGVFEPELQAPAGIYDELEVEKLLAPNVAVVASGSAPTAAPAPPVEATGAPEEDEESEPPRTEKEELRAGWPAAEEEERPPRSPGEEMGRLDGAALVESTLPLGTETPSGATEPVDLGLEGSGNGLQPANPLVEVEIPENLGEGIDLPEVGVQIELLDSAEARSPSVLGEGVALYPNVATNTDLAVAPTPTGVETMAQVRSDDAPSSQIYKLTLPPGAVLEATAAGGALVHRGEEGILEVPKPTALDATGAEVPVTLTVAGDELTVTAEPDSSSSLPILVDPLFQVYEWNKLPEGIGNSSGICSNSIHPESENNCMSREEWGYERTDHSNEWGHVITDNAEVNNSGSGPIGIYLKLWEPKAVGDHAGAIYTVPRYFKESPKPTSFIGHLTLSNLTWTANSTVLSPYLFAGIWDAEKGAWVSYYTHEGLSGHSVTDTSFQYQFPNENAQHEPDTNAKVAELNVLATEVHAGSQAHVFDRAATVELGDHDVPQAPIATGPASWVNQMVTPITFTAGDTGLGVYAISASTEQLNAEGQPLHSWKASYGCLGVGDSACPRTWKSGEAGHPALNVEPALLPNGIDYLNVVAEDPVGNKSPPSSAQIKVDHTAPQIALSGSATEQATFGTKRASYTLKAEATDGTSAAPQSGVKWEEIDFHGEVLAYSEPGCATQNCAISLEGKIEASKYPAGTYTATITAMDAVGLVTTKHLEITLNPSPPTLALSGTMTEQGTLGTSRPRYKLKASAEAATAIESVPGPPSYMTSFGSSGTGNGQFSHPGDIAQDPKGNLWVVDEGNNRVEEFTEGGTFLKAFGALGAANGQFNRPTALAIDSKGNLWVLDAGNHRVQEFNEKGEFLKAFGSSGTGEGQLSTAEGIAVDSKGNIYVADTYNARIVKFSGAGEFLKNIGTRGSGTGQLIEPTGIDIGPGGNIWVTDWANNKVVVFNEAGGYLRQFGSAGTGNGQFAHPDALAIDSRGEVWVGDQNNERVQEFNQAGEYLTKFGATGSGSGQFTFGYPMGLAVDTKGDLWVTDTGNNRVQKWSIPVYVPAYSSSFGTFGSGNGQFSHPADVAIDPKGNLWVADEINNRLEEFNQAGQFIKSLGSAGTGNGQFGRPRSIAFAANGNFWVADSENGRLEEFSESGTFLKAVGSSGTGNGHFAGPEGIAIDAKGNIWVSDTYNYRIQELNEAGEFIKVVNPTGMGAIEPTGIDVGPGGNVWVADWAHNRVVELSEAGGLLRSFGTAGTGNGQLNHPDAIAVDDRGTVWVGDQGNSRIQAFNQSGEYVNQFGTAGTGAGQFSFAFPLGIATDDKGNFWITDANNNRVQKWSQDTSNSEIATEITFDGTKVESGNASCSGERCPLTREWTLESNTKSAEGHTVLVKSTDGLGNTTTKTLSIGIQRDKTAPAIQLSGALPNAPEGWVEQQPYTFNATATDGGYGVTQVKLTIDGTTVAQTKPATCTEGGCEKILSSSVNTSTLAGGAHTATVTATDGAGNVGSKSWTVNVDPEGHVSTVEVEDTLEAAEETGSVNTVGLSEEEEGYEGTATGLGVKGGEEAVVATGTMVPTEIATDPEEGTTLEILEPFAFEEPCEGLEREKETAYVAGTEEPGEPPRLSCEEAYEEHLNFNSKEEILYDPLESIEVEPVTVAAGAGEAKPVNEAATVAADTASQVDTVTRPLYDGVLTFQDIRDVTAPTEFTWEVHLEPGQELKLLDSQHAEIYYEGGHPAFGIEAVPAHDAVGTDVPASLAVSGRNLITLIVQHRQGNYVYPVLAGAGWQGGFQTVVIQGPKDEQELREEREREEEEAQEKLEELWQEPSEEEIPLPESEGVAIAAYGPPSVVPQGSTAWGLDPVSLTPKERKFKFTYCWPHHIPGSYGSPEGPLGPTPYPQGGTPIGGDGDKRPGEDGHLPAVVSHCHNPEFHGIHWAVSVHGGYQYKTGSWVWVQNGYQCDKWGEEQPLKELCLAVPGGEVKKSEGPVHVFAHYRFHVGKGDFGYVNKATCLMFGGSIYPRPPRKSGGPYERPLIFSHFTRNGEESCGW